MLLNLGSEYVSFSSPQETMKIFPFHHLEESLSSAMVQYYRQHSPQKLFVINGPGSFTNLRVGALIVNLLQVLSKGTLQLFVVDKLTLLSYLAHQTILPRHGYVYFGQRKNFWIYDALERSTTVYSKKVFAESAEKVDNDYFVDRFVGEDFPFFEKRAQDLSIEIDQNKVVVNYQGKAIEITDIFEPTTLIKPVYGIDLELSPQHS